MASAAAIRNGRRARKWPADARDQPNEHAQLLTDRRFDLYRIDWTQSPRGPQRQPARRPGAQQGPGGG